MKGRDDSHNGRKDNRVEEGRGQGSKEINRKGEENEERKRREKLE